MSHYIPGDLIDTRPPQARISPSRYHVVYDSPYLGQGDYAMPRDARSFIAEQPPRHHSRARSNSLAESTLVNEPVGRYRVSAFRQGPSSYIDAASIVTDPPNRNTVPPFARNAPSERRRLEGPMWVARYPNAEQLAARQREEARRRASAYYELPPRSPTTPSRHVERYRLPTPSFPVGVRAQRPNRPEEGVRVTLDKSFDKIGFMILSDDGKSAHWVGKGGLSTPPTLSKKRVAPTANATRRKDTIEPTASKPADPSSHVPTRHHRRRGPVRGFANASRNPAPSEKAASNKDADETKSVKSDKSKRSNASNASRKSAERHAGADTVIDEGSTLGINLFFD